MAEDHQEDQQPFDIVKAEAAVPSFLQGVASFPRAARRQARTADHPGYCTMEGGEMARGGGKTGGNPGKGGGEGALLSQSPKGQGFFTGILSEMRRVLFPKKN